MSDALQVAIVGLVGSGIGGFFSVLASNRVMEFRLKSLEDKVNKHNNIIERTYALEERITVNEEKIKILQDE